MASPYALDFSPIQQLGHRNKQLELAWAKNKLAEDQNAREVERLGFERKQQGRLDELFPYQVRSAKTGAESGEQMLPYTIRKTKTETEAAEEALANQRAFRADPYADGGVAPPGAASKIPQTQYMPLPGATQPSTVAPARRASMAKEAADFVDSYVLKVPGGDPAAAESNWNTLITHPKLASAWQEHAQAFGVSGDWRRDAADFVRDMRHEASGVVLKPWQAASAAAVGNVVGAQAPGAPPSPAPQAPAAPPQTPAQGQRPSDAQLQDMAVQALYRDKARLNNMIRNGIKGSEELAKHIMEQEKAGQYMTPYGMVPLKGAAETAARAAGLKDQAQRVGEGTGAAQVNLPAVLNSGNLMIRNIDAVLTDKGLSQVTGTVAGHPWSPTVFQSSADTEARLKQIQGGVFVQAYQSLKGAGAITDIEGGKASISIARLNETRQSPAAYKAALIEAKADVQDLMHLAAAKAAGPGQAAQEAQRIGLLQEARAVLSANAQNSKFSDAQKAAAANALKEDLRQKGIDPSRL